LETAKRSEGKPMRNRGAALAAAILLVLSPALAAAQDGRIDVADSGDTAWILTCSALVLLIAMPGLALFYGGLARARNVLSVMLQCGAIVATVSLLWIAAGYTIAFGQVTNGWLGAGNARMLDNLGNVRAGLNIPESAFVLFQMALAAIPPAVMAGAWLGRARFGWVIGFCALWSLAVYAPVAHWVWGGGWLASRFGTLDFAGGMVMHGTAGVSALVVALLLGARRGFSKSAMLPHSAPLAIAGAGLLWVGWFGFNGGWALAASDDAAAAIINTHASACAAALCWLLIERLTIGKPTGIGFATGIVAGLVTVTPAAGFIAPGAAILFGVAGAGLCYPAIRLIKRKWLCDDALDVFAVHGVGGITGSLLLAIFLSPGLDGIGYAEGMTMGSQFVAQIIGVGASLIWAAVASAVLALAVSVVVPMRVDDEAEQRGLDIASHGERAWDLD
jgi:Amt family ammonium transporter